MMRLGSILTARYNWRRDELSMGQKEMAALWGVGERTVKREVKHWLATGLLICTRNGVRGRVAAYKLNLHRLGEMTQPIWDIVGPDFAERMRLLIPGGDRVIRLETHRTGPETIEEQKGWAAVSNKLKARFPSQHDAWIAPLSVTKDTEMLVLETKNAFSAEYIKTHFGRDIVEAAHAEWGREMQIVIRSSKEADRA